jgi:hypothetical protein
MIARARIPIPHAFKIDCAINLSEKKVERFEEKGSKMADCHDCMIARARVCPPFAQEHHCLNGKKNHFQPEKNEYCICA